MQFLAYLLLNNLTCMAALMYMYIDCFIAIQKLHRLQLLKKNLRLLFKLSCCIILIYLCDQMENFLILLFFFLQELMGRPIHLKFSERKVDESESKKEPEDVPEDQPAES